MKTLSQEELEAIARLVTTRDGGIFFKAIEESLQEMAEKNVDLKGEDMWKGAGRVQELRDIRNLFRDSRKTTEAMSSRQPGGAWF